MKIASPEKRSALYEQNMKQLPPWLRERMEDIPEEELWEHVAVTPNAEGQPVCRRRRGEGWFHITSEHPLREAELWSRSITPQGAGEIFLYGAGFGYSLFALFEKKMPHTLVVVFEQDLYLFKAMLYYFDLSPIIETQKILFLVGDSSCFQEAFKDFMYSMLLFSTTYPDVIYTLPAGRNYKKEYLDIHRYVFQELSFLTSCLGNSHQDNMLGLRNLIANAGVILDSPYLSCLKDRYKNTPALIVSNGPSLDRSIPKLREVGGRALMIAVESAIVPLTKNGITPDILAVQERTKYTYLYHFEGRSYPKEIALLSLAMADPRVFPSFAGEKLPIFRSGEETNRWFNRNLGDGSALDAGLNVSHLATAIALYLGADPIIFVGQDFAYGTGGVTHSRDAVASQEQGRRAREILHAIPTVYVEGNEGDMIPSNQLWANFRLGLERMIAEHPERRFYNATEGGAKIRGTERAALERILEQYRAGSVPRRVGEVIAEHRAAVSVPERRERLLGFIAEMEEYARLFRNLAEETNLKRLECETMMLLSTSAEQEQYHALLDETYSRNINLYYEYAGNILLRCFFQQLILAYFHLLNRLGAIDTQEKITQAFSVQCQFFHDLRVVSQSLRVTFEEGAQSLRDLLRERLEGEAE